MTDRLGRVRVACFAAVVTLTVAGASVAAQPRASQILTSNSVRLSDLFSGLDAGQDCDIGPAPAPGKRLVIEQAQLEAIAAQFSVAWLPGTAHAQVVLVHAVRLVQPFEYLPQIRAALLASGAPADMDIHLLGDPGLSLPVEYVSPAGVDFLSFDPQSGAFSAGLRFASDMSPPISFRITGSALEMVDLPVLKRTLEAGDVITSTDLQTRRLRRNLVGSRTVLEASDAVGLALRNRVQAGAPLSLDELRPPMLIARGMAVALHFESAGLILSAKGEAIEPGALGERIHILNAGSRSVLVGRVTGPGIVQLDPVVPPVFLPSRQSGLPQPYSFAGVNSGLAKNWSSKDGSGL